jgi:hypothetical protein
MPVILTGGKTMSASAVIIFAGEVVSSHKSEHRPHPKIDIFMLRLRKRICDRVRPDAERDRRLRVNGLATIAIVQPGDIRSDQFSFSRAERRITAQQHFVILPQWPRSFWKSLKNLQQARLPA